LQGDGKPRRRSRTFLPLDLAGALQPFPGNVFELSGWRQADADSVSPASRLGESRVFESVRSSPNAD
jgi:hypothetical protein